MNDLVEKTGELYGLRLCYVEKVAKGFLSENHILSDGNKKYFLKKYRFDNEKKIREIHSAKEYFSCGGIPVVLPIVNKEGHTFFFFENGYFSLFPFICEKQLERKDLTDTAIVSFGEMLGRMHLLGGRSKIIMSGEFHRWKKETALETIKTIECEISKKTILTSFEEMAKEGLLKKQKLILSNSFSFEEFGFLNDHLIHGDYLYHNVFFSESDRVSHVFDLEKADYSPRMYEFWRSLMYTFLEGKVDKEDMRKAKLYKDSYEEIYPTTQEEMEKGLLLFYIKTIHGLWIETEHYIKNNMRVDCFLAPDFERVEYLSKNLEKLKSELL